MQRIDRTTVQLTDAEQVVKSWHDDLLDQGMGIGAAVDHIAGNVPDSQPDHPLSVAMADEGFVAWLRA